MAGGSRGSREAEGVSSPTDHRSSRSELAGLGHRLSGTAEDRTACRLIREAFEAGGWEVKLSSFRVPGHYGESLTAHLIALLGLAAVYPLIPSLALACYLLVLTSFWGELTFQFHLMRRVLPRHTSWNVEARAPSSGGARRVVILAHHDSPRSGLLWHDKIAGRVAPFLVRLGSPFNRFLLPPFLAASLLGLAMALRSVDSSTPLSAILALPALVGLGLTLAFVVQWTLSPPSPGANDNLSGVLALLELLERFPRKNSLSIDLRLVATGAEEAGFFGVIDYLKRNGDLSRKNTLFINVESIGGGLLTWATGEAFMTHVHYPQEAQASLTRLETASSLPTLPRTQIISPTDALPVARSGFPVLTLIGLRDRAIPPNYHRPTDTYDRLDQANIRRAADIIEAMVRGL